ncbi:MAG: cellulase family glycosylhydrolase, partial [Bacteroidota bacterium]
MKRFTLLAVLATCSLFASAQIDPATAVAEMGRGINLGNTLEPPREGEWNNGPAQESYFDRYVEAGFTNVRIPVRWDLHTGNSAPYTVEESWMNRVEQVVDWGLERGLYVTLNGHHEDWLKNGYANQNLRDRYDAIWRQIVARFQDKSEKLLYEIINEPIGLTVAQVDELNARILGIIRAEEPTRLVIYGGNRWSNAEELYLAAIPDDDYVIGYFHSYDPWPFAGEANRDWGSQADSQAMTNKLNAAAAWSASNNMPIHVSEFGAHVDNDYNSRMRYYAHYVEQLTKHKFAWSVWDDGGWFRVLDRDNGVWPALKDVLMHTYEDSPNDITAEAMPLEDDPAVQVALVNWNVRSTGNDSIRLEKAVAGEGFVEIARLAPNAEMYLDEDVQVGRTYRYRVYTTRADGTLLYSYPVQLRISTNVQSTFTGMPLEIPGTINTKNYDLGGEGVAYHDNEEANIPGGFRPDEGVDLEPNGKGDFHIGYVNQGEWVEYTVNVATAGTYRVSASIASEQSGGAWEIGFADAETIRMAAIQATGGWTTHQDLVFNDQITLPAGEQVMRLTITGGAAFNIDEITFTLEKPAAIASSSVAVVSRVKVISS